MLTIIVITILLAWPQAAEKYIEPVISATDPFYLGCVTWTGKEWTNPTARSARAPIRQSSKGRIAYAEVVVTVNGDECENTTLSTLFPARDEDSRRSIRSGLRKSQGMGFG